MRASSFALLILLFLDCTFITICCKSTASENPPDFSACLMIQKWYCEGQLRNLTAGLSYDFYRELKNNGPALCKHIVINYLLSSDPIFSVGSSDFFLEQDIILTLSQGQTSSATMSLTIPTWVNKGQKYWVGMLITSSSCTNTCSPSSGWEVTINN